MTGKTKQQAFATYLDRLKSIPQPGGNGCHPALLGRANDGLIAGISPEQIVAALRQAIPKGTRRVSDREITDAVNKAVSDHRGAVTLPSGEIYRRYLPPKPDPLVKSGTVALQRIIAQGQIPDEADLWGSSPIRLDWPPEDDTGKFLHAMFAPSDLLFIGERQEAGTLGGTIRMAAKWIKHFQDGGKAGPHILINPLNGLPAKKKTGDGEAFRGDGNVSAFRYCMAEFDSLSREDQISFWSAVKLPVVALVDSGGKSIHAWISIEKLAEVKTAADWQREIKGRLYDQGLIPLSVDSACSNPARLSRLPGHFREETKKYQKILWLNTPEPKRGDCERVE